MLLKDIPEDSINWFFCHTLLTLNTFNRITAGSVPILKKEISNNHDYAVSMYIVNIEKFKALFCF